MPAWIITFGLLVVCSLASFAIGLVVGGDLRRGRIVKQLAQQLREDEAQAFRRANHV